MPSNPLKKILDRRGGADEDSPGGALEKLHRGIEESRQVVLRRNEELARAYFEGSIEALRQQVGEDRATLEALPEQVPDGQEEVFKKSLGKLIESYAMVEKALDEAVENAAGTDAEEPDGSEPADDSGSEAEDTGPDEEPAAEGPEDATRIEDVGEVAGGLVAQEEEVVGVAEQTIGDVATEQRASDAARRKADELGVNLSEIEGTGPGGSITVRDVTRSVEPMGESVDVPSVQDVEDAGESLDEIAKQDSEAADTGERGGEEVAEVVEGAAQDVGGDGETSEEPKATSAARRRAEELGIDLASIRGSGAGGLITIQDVVKL